MFKKMLNIKIQHVFMALFERAAVIVRKISQKVVRVATCRCVNVFSFGDMSATVSSKRSWFAGEAGQPCLAGALSGSHTCPFNFVSRKSQM